MDRETRDRDYFEFNLNCFDEPIVLFDVNGNGIIKTNTQYPHPASTTLPFYVITVVVD